MKKLLLTLFISVLMVSFAYAQTKNVKKAYRIAESYENPEFYDAEVAIKPALTDPQTKDVPYTWWVAGHIQDRKIAWENEKKLMGQSSDEEIKQEAAYNAYDYFIKCTELEKEPNEKGKISDKYTKKVASTLAWYYNTFLIFNYGLEQAKYENYKTTISALEKHLAIVDLPFMQAFKGSKELPKPQKDTTYYKIKFYVAIYKELAGEKDNAISDFEVLKNKGHKETEIYQYLYNLYVDKKDTANMMRILNEGAEKFPDKVVFLGLIINLHIEKGQKQEAFNILNKAIERNPTNAEYYTIRGQVNRDLGKEVEALSDYNKAIQLDPTKAIYYYNKAEFLFYKALDLNDAASKTLNTGDVNRLKAQVAQNLADAKKSLLKAIEIDGDHLKSLILLRNIETRDNNQNEVNRLNERIKQLQ